VSALTPPLELHLPDLPEVPVTLGSVVEPGRAARPPEPLGQRLRNALSAYLPLLLMAALAASTWWLVKHTPKPPEAAVAAAPGSDPDYTMSDFAVVRFDTDGRVALRIEGREMRHYPDTDRLEVDDVRIHAIGPDGRRTEASARKALANGDGSEVQLLGGAQVASRLEGQQALEVSGEFLHAFVNFERLRSHLPVLVRHGDSLAHAGGLDYDNLTRQLVLAGPVRSTFMPAGVANKPPQPTPAR
jgi:lipopolysaccharide export system protein LptC